MESNTVLAYNLEGTLLPFHQKNNLEDTYTGFVVSLVTNEREKFL